MTTTSTDHRVKLYLSLCLVTVLAFAGCESSSTSAPQQAEVRKPSVPDPSVDEASNLVKACGAPSSDTKKSFPGGGRGGVKRSMKWNRYNVEVWLLKNAEGNPKWASIGVFLIGGDDTIDRDTLAKRMPCSQSVNLYALSDPSK